jgi:phage antirepressor YoqD-like protein
MYQLIPDSGFEIYVDPETNELGTSLRGAARILEIAPSTLEYKLKGVRKSGHGTSEIVTTGGLQGVRIIPANDLFLLSFDYNPELAKKMGQAGAAVYLAGLAGYEIKPQKKAEPLTRLEILEVALAAEKGAIEAKAALAAAQPHIAIATAVLSETIALSMSDYQKTVKVNGKKLGRNTYYQLLRDIKVFAVGRPLPLQKFIDSGYFEVRDSGFSFAPVTWITPKGQAWLPGHIEKQLNEIPSTPRKLSA